MTSLFLLWFLVTFLGLVFCENQKLLISHLASDLEIASYVGDLIADFNLKASSSTVNDVALIPFEEKPNFDLFNEVLRKIPLENAVLFPLISSKTNSRQIRKSAFVIIFSDVFNGVRTT